MTYPMYQWAKDLWKEPRSLTGHGNRETLEYIDMQLGGRLTIHEVPSGTKCFDWTVPPEWNCRMAHIADENGKILVDYDDNNLHVIGYSDPVDALIIRDELESHLYSLPDYPGRIPYITSYYRRRWGFCLTQNQRDQLGSGPFRVLIDSSLDPQGSMSYGELVIPGQEKKEILLSTYICHPSMANDNLSGVVVLAALAKWLKSQSNPRYTYRILFLPETIGSIYYLSRHLDHLREHVIAGFVLSCCGDERAWTYLESRDGDTLADRAIRAADVPWDFMGFDERGSDERQWCLAGLPVALLMRSGFGRYPEYHTSLDDLSVISQRGLSDTLAEHQKMITLIENNYKWKLVNPCEPFLSAHNLYPDISERRQQPPDIIKIIGYMDGKTDLIDLFSSLHIGLDDLLDAVSRLADAGIIVHD